MNSAGIDNWSALRAFLRDTSGALAVWGALAAPVVVGSAAFSVDASRLYAMEHDLQVGADALARAGAAELDQRDDALERATRAIQTLVRNDQKFAKTGRGEVGVEQIRFLSTLPAAGHLPVTTDMVTNDPQKARYVEVRVAPETVRTFFPTDMVVGTIDVRMDADATAGFTQRVCGAAPLFVCNPYEDTSTDLYEAMDSLDFQRRQFQFKRPTGQTKKNNSSSTSWGPGSFGYLEMPGYQGTSAMREAVGIDMPDICMGRGESVRLETGNMNSMHFGFNVRFDQYDGPMSKYRSDPAYAPAANVVRGVSGKGCNMRADSDAFGMPKDSCHEQGTCPQMGDGAWDFLRYMEVNHNGMSRITLDGITYSLDYKKRKVTPAQAPSRYSVYRWEIDTDCVPGKITYGRNASTPEEGIPQCHTKGPSTADVDRRVLYAAVLNCKEIERTVGMRAGVDLPVETFVKVFLTEPVGSGSNSTIYGEIVGPVIEGIDSVASERAELRR